MNIKTCSLPLEVPFARVFLCIVPTQSSIHGWTPVATCSAHGEVFSVTADSAGDGCAVLHFVVLLFLLCALC